MEVHFFLGAPVLFEMFRGRIEISAGVLVHQTIKGNEVL